MANILEFWPLTSRVAAWTGVSYHWISPISSSPQWCPGSAPAWRPPGCRESVCRATAVLGRHEPALGVPLPVQLLDALHRQAGLGPEDVDHHHVGRHLHRLGAGSIAPSVSSASPGCSWLLRSLGLNHKHNATSTRNIATVLPPSAPGNAFISVTIIIFGWTPFPATTNY